MKAIVSLLSILTLSSGQACLHNTAKKSRTAFIYEKTARGFTAKTIVEAAFADGRPAPVKLILTKAKTLDAKVVKKGDRDFDRFVAYEKVANEPLFEMRGVFSKGIKAERKEIPGTDLVLSVNYYDGQTMANYRDYLNYMVDEGVYPGKTSDDIDHEHVKKMYKLIEGALLPEFGYRLAVAKIEKKSGAKALKNFSILLSFSEETEAQYPQGPFQSASLNAGISTHTPTMLFAFEDADLDSVSRAKGKEAFRLETERGGYGGTFTPHQIINKDGLVLIFKDYVSKKAGVSADEIDYGHGVIRSGFMAAGNGYGEGFYIKLRSKH